MPKANEIEGKGESIKLTDNQGNVKEELEIVDIRDNDKHPGTFIIEVKEIKK